MTDWWLLLNDYGDNQNWWWLLLVMMVIDSWSLMMMWARIDWFGIDWLVVTVSRCFDGDINDDDID